jgi:hypothetical protein
MRTVHLDMTISAVCAREEWEFLPDKDSTAKRSAFWRRYIAIRDAEAAGLALRDLPEVTYLESGPRSAPTPQHQAASLKPTTSTPVKNKLDPTIIVPRIEIILRQAGYNEKGGIKALQKKSGLGVSCWHTAMREKVRITARFVDAIATATGARLEYLINGEEPIFEDYGPVLFQPGTPAPAPVEAPSRRLPTDRVKRTPPSTPAAPTPTLPPDFGANEIDSDALLDELGEAIGQYKAAKARLRQVSARITALAA